VSTTAISFTHVGFCWDAPHNRARLVQQRVLGDSLGNLHVQSALALALHLSLLRREQIVSILVVFIVVQHHCDGRKESQ
jgi:hypothetical protein